jgi:hypothetical protein
MMQSIVATLHKAAAAIGLKEYWRAVAPGCGIIG